MNLNLFIARRMIRGGRGSFSRPVVRISMVSVALGLAVMIISVAVVTGFQEQVSEKITGFAAHIQVSKFDANNSYEYEPVANADSLMDELRAIPGIRHMQPFALKAGIIKTNDEIQGIVFKGVDAGFDWNFFLDKMVEGRVFHYHPGTIGDSVIVSRKLAEMLRLKTGDALRSYFIIDNQARGRKFVISGIYNTGLDEFDKLYILGDMRQVQKLNGWDEKMASGIDIYVTDISKLGETGNRVYESLGYELDARTIREMYPQLFDWLDLLDINVVIILVLMVIVATITLVSTLLILILERTSAIGILKALGSPNRSVRSIFLIHAVYIIGIGMLAGNLAGIGLCLLQQHYGWITLPQESYFMSTVPVNLDFLKILLINIFTLAVCLLVLLFPSWLITRISPVKAIRFE